MSSFRTAGRHKPKNTKAVNLYWLAAYVESVSLASRLNCKIESVDANSAGSELNPLDNSLRDQIFHAQGVLETLSRSPDDWLEFHNALTTYVVMAILAATGARPVNDPFESPLQFDWDSCRIFLSDKTSVRGLGRLLPVPPALIELLSTCYLPHLQQLSSALAPMASALAKEIGLLSERKESKHLPFFFLLRSAPCLSWASVTERSLENSELFRWPLPANLMRHRLSTRLREMGCDAEIIDAILGHAEHGVLTHGDESPRCWSTDMREVAPALNRAYSQLGFATSVARPKTFQCGGIAVDAEQLLPRQRAFGGAARERARIEVRKKGVEGARTVIRKALTGRAPQDLTAKEWDDLAIKLLTIDGKRPHPQRNVRYELLQRWQTQALRRSELNIQRSFVLDQPTHHIFTIQSIGVQSHLCDLEAWLDATVARHPPSKLGVRQKLVLATLELLITCRLSAVNVLLDILRACNYRVVHWQNKFYLEHHRLLDNFPQAPVSRYRVTRRCACWLDSVQGNSNKVDAAKFALPESWTALLPSSLRGEIPATAGNFVVWLSSVVGQANQIDRPGLVAGYLSGRLACSALPHQDAFLSQSLILAQDPPTNSAAPQLYEEDLEQVNVPLPKWARCSDSERLSASQAVIKAFRENLAKYCKEQLSGVPVQVRQHSAKLVKDPESAPISSKDIASRRDLVNALKKELSLHENHLSSAIWGLCSWVIALTGQRRQKDSPYAISSVLRYLSALGQRFIEVGSDFDLLNADSDDITDFYDQVLELNRELDLQYVVARLMSLHGFLRRQFAVQDPQWDELDSGSEVPAGSPGTLWPRQYLNALQLLSHLPDLSEHECLACANLLLLAFRFGLRVNDSVGLMLSDVFTQFGVTVVHVHPNRLRSLKRRRSGNRLVPLVEEMTSEERAVFQQFLEFSRALSSGSQSPKDFPLFAKASDGTCFDQVFLRNNVNAILKEVCSNPGMSIHKGRHAFANRMAEYLMAASLDAAISERDNDGRGSLSKNACMLLLGTLRSTRRAPWAVSRMLGHWRPRTSFKSYIHHLPEWADTWAAERIDALDRGSAADAAMPSSLRNLDALPCRQWQAIAVSVQSKLPDAAWSIWTAVEYLDLIRGGASSHCARAKRVPQALVDLLGICIETTTDRIRERANRPGDLEMGSLLQQIGNAEWNVIMAACSKDAFALDRVSSQVNRDAALARIKQVSPNRQILLWEKAHFKQTRDFLNLFGIDGHSVRLDNSRARHATIDSWLSEFNLARYVSAEQSGTRPDLAYVGDPPQPLSTRCALITKQGATFPHSGYGLTFLWLLHSCMYPE